MHILVYDNSRTYRMSTAAGGSTGTVATITTPTLRPRLEGQRTALRGNAFNAKLADYAQVTFTVRVPVGELLNNFQAELIVLQSPLLGQDPAADYPNYTTDVSSLLPIDGRLTIEVALLGVCQVALRLTRVSDPSGGVSPSLFVMTQVLAEERSVDVEHLDRMRDVGEV